MIRKTEKEIKKTKKRLRLRKIIFLTVIVFLFSKVIVAKSQIMKINNENNKLIRKINSMKNINITISQQNQELLSSIEKKEVLNEEKIKNTKTAYLTFDDGPSENTLGILKVLKSYNVKATFFVNGHERYIDLYEQIIDDGHVLGNHTYTHDSKNIYKSVDTFKEDLEKLDNLLTKTIGEDTNGLIRYPGGSNNTISTRYGGKTIMTTIISELNKEGYIYFDWNVDSTDASKRRQDKDKIVEAVLTQSKHRKKAIILMHDLTAKTTTVQALPEIIEGLKKQEFVFDVLSKDSYNCQFIK